MWHDSSCHGLREKGMMGTKLVFKDRQMEDMGSGVSEIYQNVNHSLRDLLELTLVCNLYLYLTIA
jgi:hypothetical protein